MTLPPIENSRKSTNRKLVWLAFALILILAAFLRFYDLGADGYGNNYYAATVKSMLTSWHNFFYASFEPGGSVSVDKPPLGFWMQSLSALIFGVNGFALALPQALAGVASVALLFFLLRKPFGDGPALLGAFVLAVTPVAISAERNNTIDGQLAFVLLLAAWALLKSISDRRLRWLLLAAFLVGIGFNIKMLQAYMVLPGFYLVYLLAARHGWFKRILHLAAATVVLLVVSFAWVLAVEWTPAENRPYVGSSDNNSMLELVFGHNASDRFSLGTPGANTPGAIANPPADRPQLPTAPAGDARPPLQDDAPANRPGGANETGSPGIFRLFSDPLINEIGWALPLAMAGMILAAIVLGRRGWGTEQSTSLLLWAGWLIPCMVFFSFTSGIFHSYYVIMIAAPIAALVAAGAWALLRLRDEKPRLAVGLALLVGTGTLAYQLNALQIWPEYIGWVALAGAFFLGVVLVIQVLKAAVHWAKLSIYLLLAAALVTPSLWSALTTFNPNPEGNLPKSGPQADSGSVSNGARLPGPNNAFNDILMTYVVKNAPAEGYLLATPSSSEAAPFILSTGRPVLTFGGFNGSDPIVDAEKLADLVSNSTIKLVLVNQNQQQGQRNQTEIRNWLAKNCVAVNLGPANRQNDPRRQAPANAAPQSGLTLYNCGK